MEHGLDGPRPARTQLLPDAFVSRVSHFPREPGLGACLVSAGYRATETWTRLQGPRLSEEEKRVERLASLLVISPCPGP